jgi:hypothetical protein
MITILGRGAIDNDAQVELLDDIKPLFHQHLSAQARPLGPVWWVTRVMPRISSAISDTFFRC